MKYIKVKDKFKMEKSIILGNNVLDQNLKFSIKRKLEMKFGGKTMIVLHDGEDKIVLKTALYRSIRFHEVKLFSSFFSCHMGCNNAR